MVGTRPSGLISKKLSPLSVRFVFGSTSMKLAGAPASYSVMREAIEHASGEK
jgi:hypothetical protein